MAKIKRITDNTNYFVGFEGSVSAKGMDLLDLQSWVQNQISEHDPEVEQYILDECREYFHKYFNENEVHIFNYEVYKGAIDDLSVKTNILKESYREVAELLMNIYDTSTGIYSVKVTNNISSILTLYVTKISEGSNEVEPGAFGFI